MLSAKNKDQKQNGRYIRSTFWIQRLYDMWREPINTETAHIHKYICWTRGSCKFAYHSLDAYIRIYIRGSPTAWIIGDPHIRTLDGLSYTFNGLGEYILLKTRQDEFTLEGRTIQAFDSYGQAIEATSYTAFAAKETHSDLVQIQVNSARNGKSSIIYIYIYIYIYNYGLCIFKD